MTTFTCRQHGHRKIKNGVDYPGVQSIEEGSLERCIEHTPEHCTWCACVVCYSYREQDIMSSESIHVHEKYTLIFKVQANQI